MSSSVSTSTVRSRKISVFQISTVAVQRRILQALGHIDRPGVIAFGARCDTGPFIVLDCQRLADELHAQRVVTVFDRHATKTYCFRERHADTPDVAAPATAMPIRGSA